MSSLFSDAAKAIPATPYREPHPRFREAMRDVASGRKTVDEAWGEWVGYCKANGMQPVERKVIE